MPEVDDGGEAMYCSGVSPANGSCPKVDAMKARQPIWHISG